MAPNQNKKRVNFASIKNPLQFPDFLEVQLKSFQDFFQLDTPPERRKKEGLYKVFAENFPIADTRNNFVLEFLDYYVDPPKYSIEECLSRGLTYSVPLKAKLKLYCTDPDHEDFATVIQDVYPLHDKFGYVRHQWCRACYRISVAPFSWGVLWDKHAYEPYTAVFSSYYPIPWLLDRVRYGCEQRDVCLHRS